VSSTDITISDALSDVRLFGAALGGDLGSWRVWIAVLKAAFGLALSADELAIFQEIAGSRSPPERPVKELHVIAGRRSAKSRMAALMAVYLAMFGRYRLAPGERGVVLIIAPTLAQTEIVFGYARGFCEASQLIRKEVEITRDEIRFRNGIVITAAASIPDTVRGRSLCAGILDEVGFLRGEGAATDVEIFRALSPSLLTTGGMLIGISTPHRRSGLLFQKHKDHYGKDDPDVLVVKGPTALFNPTIGAEALARQRASDPTAAISELDGEFRNDLSQLLDDAVIDGAVDTARPLELPRRAGVIYRAFTDSGGSGSSSFAIAAGHREPDGKLVVDACRATSPPYGVIEVTGQYAALCRSFGISEVCGDFYGGTYPSDVWRDAGIKYTRATATKSEI
jgi:hypothetical protein